MRPDPADRIAQRLATPSLPPSSDFDLNPGTTPPGRALRDAAVLLPIRFSETPRIILTKRSSALRHHPGQIAFPGGKLDPGDAGPADGALREAHEEIGLVRDNARILGCLPAHETITGFRVTPVVAEVIADFDPVPHAGEVEEVFSVPLAHVLDPASYNQEFRLWGGRRRFFYTVPYGPYYIWGATARMLRAFAQVMGEP